MNKKRKKRAISNSSKSITILAVLLLVVVLALSAVKILGDNLNASPPSQEPLGNISDVSNINEVSDDEQSEKEIAKEEEKISLVKIMMVGDNLLHMPVVDSGKKVMEVTILITTLKI